MSEYKQRDTTKELSALYFKHLSAMTSEGLHSKAAIAGELAFRDSEIEKLRAEVSWLRSRLKGKEIARAIFETGNDPGRKCTRTEFKSLNSDGVTETSMGGFCESALASFIDQFLTLKNEIESSHD